MSRNQRHCRKYFLHCLLSALDTINQTKNPTPIFWFNVERAICISICSTYPANKNMESWRRDQATGVKNKRWHPEDLSDKTTPCNISVDVPVFLNDWVFKWDQSACKWGNRIKTSPIADWIEKLSKDSFFISNFHHKRSNFQLPLLLLTAFHCACQLIAAAVSRGEKREVTNDHIFSHICHTGWTNIF